MLHVIQRDNNSNKKSVFNKKDKIKQNRSVSDFDSLTSEFDSYV